MRLPEVAWRRSPALVAVTGALGAGDEARVVGGAVRDTLLGQDVTDVDVATVHPPDAVVRRLEAAGIRAVPTGIAHGTVTAVVEGVPIEVTTLRHDLSTDGRHAVVGFTGDWRADAERRDFTMNALYADPATGEVFDYHRGLDDLAARRVRFIGDPLRRIAEDHLRILRFFRFHARFGDTVEGAVDGAGLDACTARANDLMALSRERIATEVLKLLVAPAAVATVRLMVGRGILRPVLPEIDEAGVERLATLAQRERTAGVAPDPVRRLAALLPMAAAEDVGARLKLSKVDRRRLSLAGQGVGDEGPRGLAYRHGGAVAVDRLLLAGADPAAAIGWAAPRLPINGGALIGRGLRPGPAVARTIGEVERRWIVEGFPDAARVDEIADEAVAQALLADMNENAASASSGRA